MGKNGEAAVFLPTARFTEPITTQHNKNNKNSHLTVGWTRVQKVSLRRDELCQVVTATIMSNLTFIITGKHFQRAVVPILGKDSSPLNKKKIL